MPRIEQLPPYDQDSEMALLGSMLADGSIVDDVLTVVSSPDAFYLDAHRILFRVICAMHGNRKPMDMVVMRAELESRDELSRVGGLEYLVMLGESYGDYTRAIHYANIVADKACLRSLISLGNELAESCYVLGADGAELSAKYATKIEAARTKAIKIDVEAARRLLERTGDNLATDNTASAFIPTAFRRLDANLNGLERPALIVVGARPSVGKTAMGLRLAVGATQAGVNSLFVSVEMSRERIGERLLVMQSKIPMRVFKEQMSPDDVRFQTQCAIETLGDAGMHIVDGKRNVSDIISICRAWARKGVGMVVIDYLQLCTPPTKEPNRNLEIGAMTRAFKALAIDANMTVVVLAQLSRDSVKNDREPNLTDLRDSGEIEQDADVIWFLWRKESDADLPSVPTMLKVAKNRNGPLLKSPMVFNRPTMEFTEASQ